MMEERQEFISDRENEGKVPEGTFEQDLERASIFFFCNYSGMNFILFYYFFPWSSFIIFLHVSILFLKINLFIYLFIFGYIGSSLLRTGFL